MDTRQAGSGTVIVGVLVGAVVGFAVGAGTYLVLAALLEGAGGMLEELQGLTWNLVPAGTIGGAALGWWVIQRRRGRGQ